MENENNTVKYYYSIGEVAAMFNVNTSMIRYWEKEFDVLRPRKNKKGNRLFTERDVRYVHVIYQLLKVKGYTLAGAKQALKERFSDYEERIIMLETSCWKRSTRPAISFSIWIRLWRKNRKRHKAFLAILAISNQPSAISLVALKLIADG